MRTQRIQLDQTQTYDGTYIRTYDVKKCELIHYTALTDKFVANTGMHGEKNRISEDALLDKKRAHCVCLEPPT